MTDFDQHLVDYTVRNIQTGDEEEIRVLELTDDEMADFPADVRDQIRTLIAASLANQDVWLANQDAIVRLLLPYISKRALYDTDYAAWENYVLGNDEACADCGHVHVVETGECNLDPAICNCEWFKPGTATP